jgi:hypothetical protein
MEDNEVRLDTQPVINDEEVVDMVTLTMPRDHAQELLDTAPDEEDEWLMPDSALSLKRALETALA